MAATPTSRTQPPGAATGPSATPAPGSHPEAVLAFMGEVLGAPARVAPEPGSIEHGPGEVE